MTLDGNYSVARVLAEFTQIRKTLAVRKQIENKSSCRGMNMSRPSMTVLDHANSPRNAGEMASPDAIGRASLDGNAPRMTIYLKIHGDHIERAMFQTFGCGYSIAACSMLAELVAGMPLSGALKVSAEDLLEKLTDVPSEKEFCAGLAVEALHDAVARVVKK